MSYRSRWLAVAALAPILSVILGACSTDGSSAPATREAPAVGDPAAEFTLPDARAGTVSLTEELGERPVLLYFSMGPG